MEGMGFVVDHNSKILIYGASFIGKRMYQILRGKAFNVIAFMDKHAASRKIEDTVRIYHPDEVPIEESEKKNVVVIIAITNISEHKIIADSLLRKGFEKIVFMMDNSWKEEEIIKKMNNAYEYFNSGKGDLSEELKKYCFLKQQTSELKYFWDVDNENKKGYIPSELLFYMENGIKKSIYQTNPLLSFYNFLGGKEDGEYLYWYMNKTNDTSSFIRWMDEERNRYKIVTKHLECKMEWLNENCPVVKWDHKGRFIIETGLELAVFMVSQNENRVLCQMQREDYTEWLNEPEAQRCNEIIANEEVSFLYTPILNSTFFDFPSRREECGEKRLAKICRYFYEHNIDIKGKSVLDAGAYICYFSQHMNRMGAKVTAVEFEDFYYTLAKQLNKTLYCNEIELIHGGIQDIDSNSKFQISFLLSVLNWHIHGELGKKLIETIDNITEELLFWESGDEIEFERKWILDNTTFTKYQRISNTFGTGKFREMGVFSRI